MTPLSILEKLRSLKTEKGIQNFLTKIEPENEFWLAAHHCLQPFKEWKVSFALSNPHSYGKGAPDGILAKIISGMESGDLSEHEVLIALSKVSKVCTEEQWKEWYKPVFDRSLILPFGVDLFNDVCPSGNKIDRWWVASPLVPVEDSADIPSKLFIEPYYGDNARRTIWFCTPTGARMFYYRDGKEFTHDYASDLINVAKDMGGGVIFSGVLDDDNLILRDFITFDEFMHHTTLLPIEHRLQVLEMICAVLEDRGITHINMAEIVDTTDMDIQEIRGNMNMFFEQLFPGVLLRAANSTFDDPTLVVQPKRKSVLTCVGISETELTGNGTLDKKSFETKVFYGLTSAEKEQYFKDRDSLIGSKFEILSCGLNPQGNVLFPLFKEWRK